MRKPDYAVLIEPLPDEDGGGFLATVPDLPGCMSDGETREEAARNIEDAIACWIEEARALGRAKRPRSGLARPNASHSPRLDGERGGQERGRRPRWSTLSRD
jgi:predicted RNase H-like HicB family nuclease